MEDCAPDCEERTDCTQEGFGHSQCGVCPSHGQPRHHCGCISIVDYGDPIENLSQGDFLSADWFDR